MINSPITGAQERIMAMRQRHSRVEASIEYYESRLANQTERLARLTRSREYPDEPEEPQLKPVMPTMTEEDLRREEEEVRQLEQKKKRLEDRVSSMGRDLSGVLR
jgi:predicted  nucleic acid-binding Zn-ribbon protein